MFQKVYTSTTAYYIWEVENSRVIDEHNYVPYLEWLANPDNVLEVVSGDRFITIVNGVPVEDPNKATILAQEAYAAAHPPVAMEQTLLALCRTMDSFLYGDIKSAQMYDYIQMRWYTRDITAANLATLVAKKRLDQVEANAIMATEQVPLA